MAPGAQNDAASNRSEYDDSDSSSDEEEDGCNTVEKIKCGNERCRLKRKWKWCWISVGLLTFAALFFVVVIVIMLYSSKVEL